MGSDLARARGVNKRDRRIRKRGCLGKRQPRCLNRREMSCDVDVSRRLRLERPRHQGEPLDSARLSPFVAYVDVDQFQL